MKHTFFFVLIFLCYFGIVTAQSVKFTSTYSSVLENCYDLEDENPEGEGDTPMICSAIAGYELFVYYNLYGHEIIEVQTSDDTNNYAGSLSSQYCGDSHQYGIKMEWRFADGKPFACIIRVTCNYIVEDYDEELKMNYERFEAGDQYLVVVGLDGYKEIQGEIAVVKAVNANKAARELADNAYLKLVGAE